MSTADVDAYIAALPEPKRSTIARMRELILAVIPDAEQRIAYGFPTFTVRGKHLAGVAAFTRHCGYAPHSGGVIGQLGEQLAGYTTTKSIVHFPIDEPLPAELVAELIRVRSIEAFGTPTP